ncbi:MAG: hypothetical protein HZB53_08520 [Chloroflexi bacterium]|nr:hypothetical protein [Chloroflexota bacterium]
MFNIGLDDATFRLIINLAGASVALFVTDLVLKLLGGLGVVKAMARPFAERAPQIGRFVRALLLTAIAWTTLGAIGFELATLDQTTTGVLLVIIFLLVLLVGDALWRMGLALVLGAVAWMFIVAGFGLITEQYTIALGCLLIAAAAPILWFLGATVVEAFDDVPVLAPLARAFAAIAYLLAGVAGLVAAGAGVIALAGLFMVGGGALLLILVPTVCVAILMGIFIEPFVTHRESAPPSSH